MAGLLPSGNHISFPDGEVIGNKYYRNKLNIVYEFAQYSNAHGKNKWNSKEHFNFVVHGSFTD